MKEENSDLVEAGVLWSTEAKSGLKYWSGKLKLSGITDSLIEQKGISDQVDLVGLLQGETELDLMMFVNNNRRPDKNDPHLLLRAKIGERVEPPAEEDLPEHLGK